MECGSGTEVARMEMLHAGEKLTPVPCKCRGYESRKKNLDAFAKPLSYI